MLQGQKSTKKRKVWINVSLLGFYRSGLNDSCLETAHVFRHWDKVGSWDILSMNRKLMSSILDLQENMHPCILHSKFPMFEKCWPTSSIELSSGPDTNFLSDLWKFLSSWGNILNEVWKVETDFKLVFRTKTRARLCTPTNTIRRTCKIFSLQKPFAVNNNTQKIPVMSF